MSSPGEAPQEPALSLDPGFIDDVEKRLADEGTEDVNVLINSLQVRYQKLRALENSVLQQRQRHQQKEKFNQQTLDVIETLLASLEEDKETVLDYPLAGTESFPMILDFFPMWCAEFLHTCSMATVADLPGAVVSQW